MKVEGRFQCKQKKPPKIIVCSLCLQTRKQGTEDCKLVIHFLVQNKMQLIYKLSQQCSILALLALVG